MLKKWSLKSPFREFIEAHAMISAEWWFFWHIGIASRRVPAGAHCLCFLVALLTGANLEPENSFRLLRNSELKNQNFEKCSPKKSSIEKNSTKKVGRKIFDRKKKSIENVFDRKILVEKKSVEKKIGRKCVGQYYFYFEKIIQFYFSPMSMRNFTRIPKTILRTHENNF